jgi:hypothetical protein
MRRSPRSSPHGHGRSQTILLASRHSMGPCFTRICAAQKHDAVGGWHTSFERHSRHWRRCATFPRGLCPQHLHGSCMEAAQKLLRSEVASDFLYLARYRSPQAPRLRKRRFLSIKAMMARPHHQCPHALLWRRGGTQAPIEAEMQTTSDHVGDPLPPPWRRALDRGSRTRESSRRYISSGCMHDPPVAEYLAELPFGKHGRGLLRDPASILCPPTS